MESPYSWTEAEKIIHEALYEHHKQMESGVAGLSAPMLIANALRAAGLLPPYEAPPPPEQKIPPPTF